MSAYQLFDLLTDEEYAALKEDIANRGVLVPVELDENGCILDGHHRVRAWNELRAEGVKVGDYPRIVRFGMSEEQKRNHVRALNLLRRHLSKETRNKVIADMVKDGMSTRQIADAIGVSNATVSRAGVTNVTPEERPEKVKGKDGKRQAAKKKKREKPTSIFANTPREEKTAIAAAQTIEDAPDDKVLTTKRASRIAREQENAKMREELEAAPLPKLQIADIRLGDFRAVLTDVPDNSIRLIFTDPPYPKEYLPLWSDLAKFAARVLTPGGLLVAYSGQFYLPTVFTCLTEHLQYVWTAAQLAKKEKTLIHAVKVYSAWKPLLIFAKPQYEPETWIDDVIGRTGAEKDGHEWQQAESEAAYYIEQLSSAGDTVLDPFIGSGTTGAAAVKLGRKFIGCDNDASCVARSIERLSSEPNGTLL